MIVVIISFIPAVSPIHDFLVERSHFVVERPDNDAPYPWYVPYYRQELGKAMNAEFVRPVGMTVACLSFLGVAIRAAMGITGERERGTLESLLTTPFTTDAIFFSKWLGSILSVRWFWLWLGAIWGLGIITGGLDIRAVPGLVVAWLVYAALMASLGTFFSIICRNSMRAVVWTLVTVLLLCCSCWIMPPVAFWVLAFPRKEFGNPNSFDLDYASAAVCFGLALWSFAAMWLWFSARRKLRQKVRHKDIDFLRHPRRPASAHEKDWGPW